MEKTQKMNKMGTEKISRLLLTMGVPMIISMVVQAVYNLSLIHISEPTRRS